MRLPADLGERLGLHVPAVACGAWWLVASSVGEARVAAGLARSLPGDHLLTVDTAAGAAVARGLTPTACRRPLDLGPSLAPLWAEARPRAMIWVEGAYWPTLAALAHRAR